MSDVDEIALPVVVLGGTGRVGAAVVEELASRGQRVIVVSRRRQSVDRSLVEHRVGDVHDLGTALSGVDARAVVVAVTPFTSPPETFDGFDGAFYEGIVEQLVALLSAGSRVIIVSVTAIARLDDDSLVADHEELFPGWLRPFSEAHARGADRLLASPTLDGTVLIPAAGLGVHDARSAAAPVVVPEPVTIADAMAPLDHAALARAVADQVTRPGGGNRLLVGALQ